MVTFTPVDVQVATGVPQVEAWRAAHDRLIVLRADARRAASHFEWVMTHYLTTTSAGREGRAHATERYSQAQLALATAEDALPDLASAAMRAAPAVFARLATSMEAARAYRAEQRERYAH